jgi:O-antigen/teichoic acid export membrane protein
MSAADRHGHALPWAVGGSAIRGLIQLAVGVVLARLLGPRPFGIAAIAWTAIGLANLLADLGLAAAVVQRPDMSKRDLGFVTFAQHLMGLLLAIVFAASASRISTFLGDPAASGPLACFALIFLFQGIGQVPSAVMRRQLRYRELQMASSVAYLVGYCGVGLPLAIFHYGVWSLVWAQIVTALATSFGYLLSSRQWPYWRLRPENWGHFRFGAKVSLANIVNWGLTSLDTTFIGRALGSVDLGFYNRTMSIVSFGPNMLLSPFQNVAFSMASAEMRDGKAVDQIFYAATFCIAALVFPFMVFIGCNGAAVIGVLYGSLWQRAAAVVFPLTLAMAANVLMGLIGPILTATNRVGIEIASQVATLACGIAIFVLVGRSDLRWMAWLVVVVYALRLAILALGGLQSSTFTVGGYWRALWLPLLGSLAAFAAMQAQHAFMPFRSDLLQLVISAVVGAAAYCAALAGFWKQCWAQAAPIIGTRRAGLVLDADGSELMSTL